MSHTVEVIYNNKSISFTDATAVDVISSFFIPHLMGGYSNQHCKLISHSGFLSHVRKNDADKLRHSKSKDQSRSTEVAGPNLYTISNRDKSYVFVATKSIQKRQENKY